ncbi:cell division protein FtsX [Desulfotalea psychrophila]|uniref:Cell division protein FtsX n=1 Tax=Desulfotalea psychrophila (strain LSv54 / DSM 12343) TaxID=177439 RepID=Q6AK43_DESPS|nr:permease-like cell division protein FtsX [Desulfotalea psychrophila]CAG37283.1 related to cell division protein (FtsX) [Desulfotalea psychrophila LSv54]
MSFFLSVSRQVGRNLKQTWASQLMTLLTVSLSVLIFAFFFLTYTNLLNLGTKLGDNLTLIIYLDDDLSPELQEQFATKINKFDHTEKIKFISREQAFNRFSQQLGSNKNVLEAMPHDFLPASIEVTPVKGMRSIKQVKLFSNYLKQLPGALKIQYGQEWVNRFFYFTNLLSMVVILSGILLIMTTFFMVAYTIRLTILGRQDELELLKLVGATNNYIRAPFLTEGVLQGLLGSTIGLLSLFVIFEWILNHFSEPGILAMTDFAFFPAKTVAIIVSASICLCAIGSYSAMQKLLRI